MLSSLLGRAVWTDYLPTFAEGRRVFVYVRACLSRYVVGGPYNLGQCPVELRNGHRLAFLFLKLLMPQDLPTRNRSIGPRVPLTK